MGKVSSAKDVFEQTIKKNEEHSTKEHKSKKSSSSTRTKKKKSVEKKAAHRVKDADASLGATLKKEGANSPDKHAGENSTLVTEESSTNSMDEPNTSLFDDDFGAGESDFDFDDDDWDPKVAKSKGRKSRAPVRKKNSQRKLTEEEDEGGFEVTFNGSENDATREKIQQYQLRKEGSVRSMNGGGLRKEGSLRSITSGSVAPSLLDDLDDDTMSVTSRTSTATRRSSMGRNRRGSMGRSSRNTGSAGLQYGSPECEAYINSLPPAFQVSERRRLRQKHLREQERLKQANSAEVYGKIDAHMKDEG